MLEYGLAAIITLMEKYRNSLVNEMASSNQERISGSQKNDVDRIEYSGDEADYNETELVQRKEDKNCIACTEQLQAIKREMTEIKSKINKYETLRHYD